MDLNPEKHQSLVFTQCGTCNQCCDGSLFTAGFVPLSDFVETADCFPIVFHKIYGEYWPGMIYALKPGLPCPYLDLEKKRCSIYHTYRPVACIHFPFRFKAKPVAEIGPFPGYPFNLEIDERCPALVNNVPGTRLIEDDGTLSQPFLQGLSEPKQVDFVEETQQFCRQLGRFGLFKKKKFKHKDSSGKKSKISYQIVDKKKIEQEYPDLFKRYAPYLMAHWRSLDKPKKLIESM
ncbi:MAG: SapC family protein [Magnetococcales bacterium]|nr:SapC family protein [Magnetococcales bacterium]